MLKEIIRKVAKIDGWFNHREMTQVYDFVRNLPKDGLIVELGTWKGRSTLFFRLANPDIKIITIDACEKFWSSPAPAEEITPGIVELGNIEYIQKYTSEVVKDFDKEIDFMFIDHEHTFNGVTKALFRWADFVKVGGYILFHDSHSKKEFPHNGVFPAVNEWLEDNDDWEEVPLTGVAMQLIKRNDIIKP